MDKKLGLVLMIGWLSACSWNTSNDSADAAKNRIAVKIGQTGKAAARVAVKVFPVDDTSKVPIAIATTGDDGVAEIDHLANGYYNISARTGSLAGFSDSDFVGAQQTFSQTLTLETPKTLTGTVQIQPQDDPQSIYVQALGTDQFANVGSDYTFELAGLAAANYTLRFTSTLNAYSPKFVKVAVDSQASLNLGAIKLHYLGIPVVTGLKATYDKAKGSIFVTWDSADYHDVKDYVVYKAGPLYPSESPVAIGYSSGNTNVYQDTLYPEAIGVPTWKPPLDMADTASTFTFTYRVAVRTNTDAVGPKYKSVSVDAFSPNRK